MEDFFHTVLGLSIADPQPIYYAIAVSIVGMFGLMAPVLVEIFYPLLSKEPTVSIEEQNLMDTYSILFNARMEMSGEDREWATQKLLQLSDELDVLRKDKFSPLDKIF